MRKQVIRVIVCSICLLSMSLGAAGKGVTELTMEGGKLTAEQVAQLEKESEQNPEDIIIRTKLLGYYFRKRFEDPSAKQARQIHVSWLIENAPESEVLRVSEGQLNQFYGTDVYSDAKKVLLKHLKDQPKNLEILENSANFFMLHDRNLSKELLQKAKTIDPKNRKWPAKLGQIYELMMIGKTGDAKVETANKALEQLELSYDLADEIDRDPLLGRLARDAFEAKELDKAKKYAKMMLNQNLDNWNSGNNSHHGNIILGRIALAQDDVDAAKEYLLAAGKTKGSPQLNSFGPNMLLANDLLKVGENETVLEYFDLCSKFWKMGKDKLDQWSAAVEKGDTPDFKSKLYY